MKSIIIILAVYILSVLNIYGQDVKKCDVTVVLFTKTNVGHLTQKEIKKFLLTFGQECRNNAEFSEFSNEVLFLVMDKQTELIFGTIEKERTTIELSAILREIGNPIHDLMDLEEILVKVENFKMDRQLRNDIIERLKSAISNLN